MGMVAHLRLPYSFYAHIALPVDVGIIPGQYPGCLGVDRPVYPLAVGEPLLKMHQCRVLVQPLKKGYGSNLSLGPDGNAGESQLLAEVEGAPHGLLLAGEHRIRVAVLPVAPEVQKIPDLIHILLSDGLHRRLAGLLEFV